MSNKESESFFEEVEEPKTSKGFLGSFKKARRKKKESGDYDPFVQQETRYYQHDFKKRALALLVIVLVSIIVGYALLTKINFDKVDFNFNKNEVQKQQKKHKKNKRKNKN